MNQRTSFLGNWLIPDGTKPLHSNYSWLIIYEVPKTHICRDASHTFLTVPQFQPLHDCLQLKTMFTLSSRHDWSLLKPASLSPQSPWPLTSDSSAKVNPRSWLADIVTASYLLPKQMWLHISDMQGLGKQLVYLGAIQQFTSTLGKTINHSTLNLCHAEFILEKLKKIFAFFTISQHCNSSTSTTVEDKDLLILYIAYHGWWPGDTRSQGISNHGVDLVLLEYSSFSTNRVKLISHGTKMALTLQTITFLNDNC